MQLTSLLQGSVGDRALTLLILGIVCPSVNSGNGNTVTLYQRAGHEVTGRDGTQTTETALF